MIQWDLLLYTLSLVCKNRLYIVAVHTAISEQGVICDVRKPSVMRIAPTPLYNSYRDVYDFVILLKTMLK